MRDPAPTWHKVLSDGFINAHDLLTFLNLPLSLGNELAEREFKTRIPRRFARLMEPGNPRDPLLLQVLASGAELEVAAEHTQDPLQEVEYNPIPGLIHKYYGRVLLTLAGACAINCRYCFRRHFNYSANTPSLKEWQQAFNYIKNDATISEVIFSGGDPLLVTDKTLKYFIQNLEAIPHVKTLRIHTRIPIVLPERITTELCNILQATKLQTVIVVHANHPKELADNDVASACQALRMADCRLFNQSVLLAGVNDDPDILATLCRAAFNLGIQPYYLHLLDKVQGAAHFYISDNQAKIIYKKLQASLPGYLLPRLAREEPGMPSKTILTPAVILKTA